MRSTRKESHLRRQKLLTQAKQLQARAAKYKEKVRVMSLLNKLFTLFHAHINNLPNFVARKTKFLGIEILFNLWIHLGKKV